MTEARTAMTDARIAELQRTLAAGTGREKLDAMHEAALAHGAAAALVPDIAAFLTSADYVPCTEQRHAFSGHAPLAWAAVGALESIGVAPGLEVLRRLLADHRTFVLPEACYDQGTYIGDYGSETIAPAGLAARLARLLGVDGLTLLPDLAANAQAEEELIAEPARRALAALARLGPDLPEAARERFRGDMAQMLRLPEVAAPETARGFALRDMARDCLERLDRVR